MLTKILLSILIILLMPAAINFVKLVGTLFIINKYKTKSVDELLDIMIDNAYRYQQRIWDDYLSKESLSKTVAQKLKEQIEMHSHNISAATIEAKKTMELTDEQEKQLEEIEKNFKTFLSRIDTVIDN